MATIREVILSEIPVDINNIALNRIIIDRHLIGDGTYNVSESKQVNLAIADALVIASRSADFSEGKLKITIPRAQMINDASRLYRDNGESEKADSLNNLTATDISNSW